MSKQLENMLRQTGLLTDSQIRRCSEQAKKRNVPLLDVVLKDERLSEEALADAFTTRLKIPRVRIAAAVPDPDALAKVPDKLARKHMCLPLSVEGKVLVLAMADPTDYQATQDIEFASALSVKPVVATRTEILDALEERYDAEDRIGSFLANVPDVTDLQIVGDDAQQDLSMDIVADSRTAAQVAPVVKMCNLVVHDAIKAGASDLHIEPALHDVKVRMRVDGVLRDYTQVPKWLHNPVVSRLKILAKLDIAERRLPQDGRISVQYQGRTIDIRVSTLPTHFGEKAVLRFLGGSSLPKIDKMGLNEAQTAILESAIRQPQGMILVTGPTGSGKTTTLYGLLAKRRSPEVNIVTVEDPIEYQLPGINQVQINPKAGLNFAGVLRSILRQDPDVILVGETRDQETAEVAFQAAMTGHLVLSTLHTNNAVAAVPRLFDLEVDPSIVATSLTLVIAQRLVRRICEQCKEPYTPDPAVATKLGLGPSDGPVYRGKGCPACGGTGHSGRVGLYEFFRPTTAVRKLIHERAGESDLKAAARQGGMRLLREDALEKIREGITSPDEVLRVVQIDESEVPCPQCGALIEVDFSTCPYCLHSLKHSCGSCGQSLKPEWKACPYCNTNAMVTTLADNLSLESRPGAIADYALRRAHVPEVEPAFEPPPVLAVDVSEEYSPQDGIWPGMHVINFDAVEPAVPEPIRAAQREPGRTPERAARKAPPAPPARPAPPAPTLAAAPIAPSIPAKAKAKAEPAPPAPTPAAAPAPPPPPPARLPEPAVVEAASEPRRRLRVLVVDDDEDIRQVVAFTLKKLPMPVEIVQAVDGQDAVEKAEAAPPDMVVLDVMMPRMDGFETCERLRQNVRTAFVPILMLTASADEANRSKGYLVGTDDYMSKPFLPPDLNMRVTRLLRRTYGM